MNQVMKIVASGAVAFIFYLILNWLFPQHAWFPAKVYLLFWLIGYIIANKYKF